MTNYHITLTDDDQRTHLLLLLLAKERSLLSSLSMLSTKVGTSTYNQSKVDLIANDASLCRSRIDEIKAADPFRFPTKERIEALAAACDRLATIDAATATAGRIIKAGLAVVDALPVTET